MVDSKQMGQFICTCRKEKKLTQKQLGELLDVTEKAVSKWETGRSIPDIGIIESLCEALEIDISELLSGKRIDEKDYKDETKKLLIMSFTERQLFRAQAGLYVMQMIALLLMWLPIINNQTDALLPPVTPINLFCWCACIALFVLIRYTDKKLPEKSVRMLPIINNQTDALLPPVTPINLFCWCACIALFVLIRYTDKKLPEKSVRMTNIRLEIGHGVMYMIIFMSMFFLTPNSRRLASEASADEIAFVLVIVILAVILSAVISIISVKVRRWCDKEN